jgi:hypothetical protein
VDIPKWELAFTDKDMSDIEKKELYERYCKELSDDTWKIHYEKRRPRWKWLDKLLKNKKNMKRKGSVF